MILRATLCCAALLLVPACTARTGPGPAASASTMASTAANAEYARFAREYLDAYYAEHPVRATRLGLHLYDTRLPDLSAEAFQRRAQALHGWLARLERLERSALTGDAVFDVRVLENALRAELLALEETREWQRDPMFYNGMIASGLSSLSQRAFGEWVEDAAKRYAEIAWFEPFPALREVQRGTFNPTCLYYALGRMQILKLREDYRLYLEARGQTFSLRDFHDRFLRLGLPVSLARQALMPGDTGPSLE